MKSNCFLDVFQYELNQVYDALQEMRIPKLADTVLVRKPKSHRGVIELDDHLY